MKNIVTPVRKLQIEREIHRMDEYYKIKKHMEKVIRKELPKLIAEIEYDLVKDGYSLYNFDYRWKKLEAENLSSMLLQLFSEEGYIVNRRRVDYDASYYDLCVTFPSK